MCVSGSQGGGTASLKVGTHCQTTAPAFRCCPPNQYFLPPPISEGHKPPPLKINIPNAKLSIKVNQNLLHTFLYKECSVFHKIEGIHTSLIRYCSQFEVDRPPPFFCLPQKELTAPRFWHSPLPLHFWQWVPIQT